MGSFYIYRQFWLSCIGVEPKVRQAFGYIEGLEYDVEGINLN